MQLFTSGLPSTLTDDGSGNLTFTGKWINARNGAANAPADTMTGTWFTGGTTTTTKPHFLIEPSTVTTSNNWSTAGTGFGVNGPAGFTGDLAWFGVNGTASVVISSVGNINLPTNNSGAIPSHAGIGNYHSTLGLYSSGTRVAVAQGYGNTGLRIDAGGLWIGADEDLALQRGAANALAQRNGTNAQTYWLFNTFTSTTNFERLNIRWASNEAIIDTEAGSGGGTLRGLKIGSASTSLLGFYGATPVARGAAIPDATDLASALTSLNALLARARAEGRIAT